MKPSIQNPRARCRRGIESIELLIGLPILLLVVAAGIEYGWVVLRSSQLDHAARVGARAAGGLPRARGRGGLLASVLLAASLRRFHKLPLGKRATVSACLPYK